MPSLAAGALALLVSLAASTLAHAQGEIKPWKGGAAPALALKDLDGRAVDLGALRGRVVLINFWATWCEPCRDEMPSLERLRGKLKGRPFELVMVNYGESNATVSRFVSKLSLSVPVLLDPEKKVAQEWKVGGLPMTFLVDAAGRVRFSAFGEHDWSEGEAFAAVDRVVAEVRRAQR